MIIPSRCFVFNTPLTKSSAPPLAHMAVPTGVNGLDGLGFLSVHDPELPAEPFEFGQRRVRRARIDGTPGIEYQIEIAIFHFNSFEGVFKKIASGN